jgi:hypothetical protein
MLTLAPRANVVRKGVPSLVVISHLGRGNTVALFVFARKHTSVWLYLGHLPCCGPGYGRSCTMDDKVKKTQNKVQCFYKRCTHTQTRTHNHTHTQPHSHTQIYTRTNTHTHTHTHTRTHTHVRTHTKHIHVSRL